MQQPIADVELYTGTDVLTIDVGSTFGDADGETLDLSVSTNSDGVAKVGLAGTTLSVDPMSDGTVVVTVTATDRAAMTASASFRVTVILNNQPTLNAPLADLSVYTGTDAATVDLSNTFSDMDGETLAFSATADNSSVATVGLDASGTTLHVTPMNGGTAVVTVVATDRAGQMVSTSFRVFVTINNVPTVREPLADLDLYTGTETVTIDLRDTFSDADDETLSLAVSSDRDAIATAELNDDGTTLMVTPMDGGLAIVTVVATDRAQKTVSASFRVEVTVNHPPVLANELDDVSLYTGTEPITVDVSETFSDPDEETLSLVATTDDGEVATAVLEDDGETLKITPVDGGKAVVTLVATDRAMKTAQASFRVEVTVNHAPVLANALGDVSLYTGTDPILVDVRETFSDADGETLALAVSTDHDSAATVELVDGDTMLKVMPVDGGTTVVTLVATDRAMMTATATFRVAVTINHPPMLANAIADASFYIDDDPLMIPVKNTFTDPDGEVLSLSVTSHDDSVAEAMVMMNGDGSVELQITPQGGGEANFTLTATDRAGKTVSDSFTILVKVNTLPTVIRELADATLTLGTPMTMRVDDVFEDPDAEDTELTLSAASSDTAVATASVADGMLTIDGVTHGSASVTVTATDHRMASVSDVFEITVKTTPTLTSAAQDVLFNLQIGDDPMKVGLAQYFFDADGDMLTYSVQMSGDSIRLDASNIDAGEVTIGAHRKGRTEVVATATDPGGRSVEFMFAAQVGDAEIKAAAQQGLAGYGRSVLSSVSSAISSRIESNRADNGMNLTKYRPIKRQPTPPIATPAPQQRPIARESVQMPQQRPQVQAQPAPAPAPTPRAQPQQRKSGVSWNSLGNGNGRASGSNFRMSNLVPQNFSQSLTGGNGVGSWSVWGTADSQNFEGANYDGSATNVYFGADVKSMQSLLLGAAVARNSGSYDYTRGNATQTMDVSVTSVLPYFAIEPTRRSLVWGVIGGGRGEAETTVTNSENESSDLSLFTGALGGRMTIAQSGSLELGVRGDFAYADMSTENGAGAADELSAAVNRTRIGLEGSYTQAFAGGGALTPFGEISLRSDGGDGITGTGVEVAGGFRFGSEKFRLELNGRMLATHSEEDFKESGISLMAVLNSSAMGTGLSFSLTPSWGSSTQSQNAIWAERAALGVAPGGRTVRGQNGRAVEARLGYGIPIVNDRYLLTPFLDYRTDDSELESMSLGASLTQLIVEASEFDMTFEIGRLDDGIEQPSNQFGLTAEMSF